MVQYWLRILIQDWILAHSWSNIILLSTLLDIVWSNIVLPLLGEYWYYNPGILNFNEMPIFQCSTSSTDNNIGPSFNPRLVQYSLHDWSHIVERFK